MPAREEDFKRNASFNFTLFTPKNHFPYGWGDEIYNLLSPFPTDATYQIWLTWAL